MAFAFKTIVAAVALIAANVAHAEWQFVSGSATLSLSQQGIDVIDAMGADLSTGGIAGNKAFYDYERGLSLSFTSATTSGDQIQALTSTGSTAYIERVVVYRGSASLDKLITLSDFVLDLGTGTLSANITGTDLLYGGGTSTNYGFGAIYSATSFVGGNISPGVTTGGIVTGTANGYTSGPLSLAMTSTFLTILGVPQTGTLANMANDANWGTLTLNTSTFQAPVPEPETAMSFLLGIALLGAARARRQRTA